MRNFITVLVLVIINATLFAQINADNKRILTSNEVETIFTESIKKELAISFPIFRIYEYKDKIGLHYLVLTENEYKKDDNKSFNDSIKAIDVLKIDGILKKQWTIIDFINPNNSQENSDFSIWFWTKYLNLSDLDGDGFADPIIIYGTLGNNGAEDGKIKIMVNYKNNKSVVRHQNSITDFGRNTQVDTSFYLLPSKIQAKVKTIMTLMVTDNNAIFPYGWQTNMKNKILKFKEK